MSFVAYAGWRFLVDIPEFNVMFKFDVLAHVQTLSKLAISHTHDIDTNEK